MHIVKKKIKSEDNLAFNYKSDDSFLRKLAIGAAATNETINQLKAMGFNPIELERGSTGFKIWKKDQNQTRARTGYFVLGYRP